MLSHKALKSKMLAVKPVKEEYDRLDAEFAVIGRLVKARLKAGISQAEVARRMGTQAPAVCRIESIDRKHSPSLRTLQKYAEAIGYDLEIVLKPRLH